MDKNLKEFLKYCESKIGCPYLWGGQGETLSDMVYSYARKNNQSDTATKKMLNYMKEHGFKDFQFFDCSGLAVYWLLENGILKSDTNSQGLYNKCDKITKEEATVGDWCFLKDSKGKIYHVGYITENGYAVHALDQSVGVIKTKLSEHNWIYGRPNFAFDFSHLKNLEVGGTVTLTDAIKVYNNAANAKDGKSALPFTYPAGTYYIYKIDKLTGAVNITRTKGVAGAWVILP